MIIYGNSGLRSAYTWLQTYPRFLREILMRDGETFEDFCDDLKTDVILNFLERGKILAVCAAEDKGNGFFDTHIFTPRKFSLTTKAILEFRDQLRVIPEVRRCSFHFPKAENAIREALTLAGAVETGWYFFQPNGAEYQIMVWDAK